MNVRLTLHIDGLPYIVNSLLVRNGWSLLGGNGECHHIHFPSTGAECTCGDFVWRREHRESQGCKHVQALRAVGLLEEER